MALNNQCIGGPFEDVIDQLLVLDLPQLIEMLESSENEPILRLASGAVLAHRGDPRINLDKPDMITIPSGYAQLGLAECELDEIASRYHHFGLTKDLLRRESPEREVFISHFRIAKYCVTNGEFHQFLTDTQTCEKQIWPNGLDPLRRNHPVFSVTPSLAKQYCQWLSNRTNRKFRLPTDAEWEFAASGQEHFQFPWGNEFQAGMANSLEENFFYTTPVGMFPIGASPFGLLDMAGNVEEITLTSVKENLCRKNNCQIIYETSLKGGSFAKFQDHARTTFRHSNFNSDFSVVGFRIAEDILNN